MKRRILALSIAVLLVLGLFPSAVFAGSSVESRAKGIVSLAAGDTGTATGGFTWEELADNQIAITGYTGAGGNISVPAEVNSLPVTSIAANAFAAITSITGVDIPSSVTTIGNEAFYGCYRLDSVTLHSGLKAIGENAFSGTGITSIDIPASVDSIGNQAFRCYLLTSVTLHSGLKTIGDDAFRNTPLSTVTIPDSVISIGIYAFKSCDILTSVTLGSGLQTIGYGAFSETAISTVSIPDSVESIGDLAFYNCVSLTSVTLREGLLKIGFYAFYKTAVTSIIIPDSVTVIDYYAFSGCVSLASVTLGSGLQTIGKRAFEATGITGIDIPANVTSIGDFAFFDCTSLASVTLHSGLKTIGLYAFYKTAVTSIIIPDSVTTIGVAAFAYAALQSVSIPDSITNIEAGTFAFTALQSVSIPDSVTAIGNLAFSDCTSLASVALGSGLQTISDDTFANTALQTISIPAGVTSVGNEAFISCAALEKAVIYSRTVAMGSDVFASTSITSDGIYGFAGSTAQTYATDNSIPFHAFPEVTYDSRGGSAVPSDYVVYSGETVDAPDEPTWDGYNFGGWYPTAACDTTAITFPYILTATTTLYAKWTLSTLSYDTNGGSGAAPASVTQTVSSTVTVSDGSGISRTNYIFNGWNTAVDGSGTAYASGSTFTFAADTTMFAQWTANPKLTSSVSSGTIYVGRRITLTPNIDGGKWDWANEFFSATFNSPATFTALKAGTSTITYTVEGVSTTYEVTIEESALPDTGQNFSIVWFFAVVGLLAFAVSLGTVIYKNSKKAKC